MLYITKPFHPLFYRIHYPPASAYEMELPEAASESEEEIEVELDVDTDG